MTSNTEGQHLFVSTITVDQRSYDVSVEVEHDGIEYVGHLWFADTDWAEDGGIRDQGAFPGRSPNEILATARALGENELQLRYRRAVADKRRFHGLRKITDDVLSDIRHLNKVATSMRAGLLQMDEAATEIDVTERRLHDLIAQLRHVAGVTVK